MRVTSPSVGSPSRSSNATNWFPDACALITEAVALCFVKLKLD